MSTSMGNSLPVPSVQALASTFDSTSDIPERYIRPEAEAEPVADADDGFELPVIDLRLAQRSQEECDRLGRACEEWGFFQLVNHGVAEELVDKMKADIAEFFKLPLEEKEAYAQLPDGFEGYGQIFVKSEEQKLDWGDMITIFTRPHSVRKMRFWPTHPPTFRDTLDKYTSAVKDVTSCVVEVMARNLGLDSEVMTKTFKDHPQGVRINYYPPCPNTKKVIGHSPHSDATGLTILLQANDVQGLQLRKNGKWLPIRPLPGAFIVNIGDHLEMLTNGKYKSNEHRVVVNTEKERLSIAAFHPPRHDIVLRPLPKLVQGGVENYKATTFADFMKGFFSAKLDGKNYLETLKLNK
ncbi:S-norcoclaurine synthase 1-like [Iris pallida]|uniref:S-norcoclaurine synthase 1-like n=1 Tax=Iris pallida TaxID=29817 RepID=A0AAX6EJX1_IRIPA|nr:S-norcoclaurine synthase 1-like [Iris pallida]